MKRIMRAFRAFEQSLAGEVLELLSLFFLLWIGLVAGAVLS